MKIQIEQSHIDRSKKLIDQGRIWSEVNPWALVMKDSLHRYVSVLPYSTFYMKSSGEAIVRANPKNLIKFLERSKQNLKVNPITVDINWF